MNRKKFLQLLGSVSCLYPGYRDVRQPDNLSAFSKKLHPIKRILETEGYYVWGCSPIWSNDGKVHVFYARWKKNKGMGGWINGSEIAHAVAESPQSVYRYVETVLKPRGNGFWDATTCHNPHIKKVDNKYCLFYMGNSDGHMNTQRIGLATATSLDGPWARPAHYLLPSGKKGAWDSLCTTNPSFVKHPNGQYWLYYKSLNAHNYYNNSNHYDISGNRKYGLAIAEQLEGPYHKYEYNPIIDFSEKGKNAQIEDGYVWLEEKKFKMIARDMGIFNHKVGLYLESKNGIEWSYPQIAFKGTDNYFDQPPAPHLSKYGRFERPQLLLKNGHPTHLFLTTQGGKYKTASGFVFAIHSNS